MQEKDGGKEEDKEIERRETHDHRDGCRQDLFFWKNPESVTWRTLTDAEVRMVGKGAVPDCSSAPPVRGPLGTTLPSESVGEAAPPHTHA